MSALTSNQFLRYAPRKYPEQQFSQQEQCNSNLPVNGDFDFIEFCKLSQALFNEPNSHDPFSSPSGHRSLDSLVTELDYSDFSWMNAFDTSYLSLLPNQGGNIEMTTPVQIKSETVKPTKESALTRRRANNKDEQQLKRRERNKVLARRTRLRKKFLFQSLRNQVMSLHQENLRLKEIVIRRCGDRSREILTRSCVELMPDVVATCAEQATALLQKSDFILMKALHLSQPSFCITDALLPDCPIVFASDSFIKITGYSREQVLGRNCRFLQGPDTDPDSVAKLRTGIVEGKDTDVVILNYNANGSSFWNHVFVAALRNAEGKVINFVGIQHIIQKPIDKKVNDDDIFKVEEGVGI